MIDPKPLLLLVTALALGGCDLTSKSGASESVPASAFSGNGSASGTGGGELFLRGTLEKINAQPQIAKVKVDILALPAPKATTGKRVTVTGSTRAHTGVTKLVVTLALVGVFEDLVSFVDFP